MQNSDKEQEALDYHSGKSYGSKPGKTGTEITKPCENVRDLSLAYTPGVAVPCLEIEKNPMKAYDYTSKGNTVAVVSNGTAVLGLGNIGALAGKPVMEGKAVLFKKFSGVDAVDVLVDSENIDEIVNIVKKISKTYGGINLEDIKAPECFEVERKLKKEIDIPVFHDDQHGTAIVSAAGFLNALEIAGKKIEDVKIIFVGAGAAGIACAKLFCELGAKREKIIMIDSQGIVCEGRECNIYKKEFAVKGMGGTLADAIKDADVFIGVSKKDVLTSEMLLSMASTPIVFAMANPDPEIKYEIAKQTREDVIIATGRSDYPNQINNVLAFPYVFRGALDVRASEINEEMKMAAARALAKVAKMPATKQVKKIYPDEKFEFGKDYIIPKPFDKRVAVEVSYAVAKAGIDSGVAGKKIDLERYRKELEKRFLDK